MGPNSMFEMQGINTFKSRSAGQACERQDQNQYQKSHLVFESPQRCVCMAGETVHQF